MRAHQRRVWMLPWLDERNAVACATQVILTLCKGYDDQAAQATLDAARVIDAWMQKHPADHDKSMLDALSAGQAGRLHYEMMTVMGAAVTITRRALTNDLTSNAGVIHAAMEVVMYAPGATAHVDDAMAKWRFYDATSRKKMDNELRAAFEAIWLAGEYALGYEFVGAAWPKEWAMELLIEDSATWGTGTIVNGMGLYIKGMIKRDVQ